MDFIEGFNHQKKNFAGAPMDRIRSSTFKTLVDAMDYGITFAEAVADMELALYVNRSEIRERWKLSDEEIEEAKNMGIYLAKSYLRIR